MSNDIPRCEAYGHYLEGHPECMKCPSIPDCKMDGETLAKTQINIDESRGDSLAEIASMAKKEVLKQIEADSSEIGKKMMEDDKRFVTFADICINELKKMIALLSIMNDSADEPVVMSMLKEVKSFESALQSEKLEASSLGKRVGRLESKLDKLCDSFSDFMESMKPKIEKSKLHGNPDDLAIKVKLNDGSEIEGIVYKSKPSPIEDTSSINQEISNKFPTFRDFLGHLKRLFKKGIEEGDTVVYGKNAILVYAKQCGYEKNNTLYFIHFIAKEWYGIENVRTKITSGYLKKKGIKL